MCSCDLDTTSNTQPEYPISDNAAPPESLECILALDEAWIVRAVASEYRVVAVSFCTFGMLDSRAEPAAIRVLGAFVRSW